jgi:hypothetical protein
MDGLNAIFREPNENGRILSRIKFFYIDIRHNSNFGKEYGYNLDVTRACSSKTSKHNGIWGFLKPYPSIVEGSSFDIFYFE